MQYRTCNCGGATRRHLEARGTSMTIGSVSGIRRASSIDPRQANNLGSAGQRRAPHIPIQRRFNRTSIIGWSYKQIDRHRAGCAGRRGLACGCWRLRFSRGRAGAVLRMALKVRRTLSARGARRRWEKAFPGSQARRMAANASRNQAIRIHPAIPLLVAGGSVAIDARTWISLTTQARSAPPRPQLALASTRVRPWPKSGRRGSLAQGADQSIIKLGYSLNIKSRERTQCWVPHQGCWHARTTAILHFLAPARMNAHFSSAERSTWRNLANRFSR